VAWNETRNFVDGQETDKATIDVEAQDDGVMGKIVVSVTFAFPVGHLQILGAAAAVAPAPAARGWNDGDEPQQSNDNYSPDPRHRTEASRFPSARSSPC